MKKLAAPFGVMTYGGVQRILRGLSATFFGQFVAALSAILLVPFFLNAWGGSAYGRWLSLFAICSYLTLIDFGGQNYVANILTDAYVRGNEIEFRERLSQGVSLFLVIALVAGVIFGAVLLVPELKLPGEKSVLSSSERLILIFLGLTNIISVPGGVYATIYRATGRLARGNFVGNTLRLLIFLISLGLLITKQPPLNYAIGTFLLGFFLTIFVIIDLWLHIPASRHLSLSLNNALKGVQLLGVSIFFWVITLAGLINFQGVILVLGAGLPAAAIALYSTHRMATGLLNYVGSILQTTLWPEFTRLHSQQRNPEIFHLSVLIVKITVVLSGLLAIVLWIFLPVIYPIWTNRQLPLQNSLFVVLLFQGVLAAGWTATAWPVLASNQPKRLAYASLLNALITIGLSFLAVTKYGVLGVALATLAGDLIFGLVSFPIIAAQQIKFPVKDYYLAIIYPLLILIFLAALMWLLISNISYPSNLVVGLLTFLIFLFPVIWFSIGKKDLGWLVANFQNLFAKSSIEP